MKLGQSISQKQTQSLAMTPELQQSLKMLQLSSLDLAEYIQGEMDKNPLLADGSNSEEVVQKSEIVENLDSTQLANSGKAGEVMDHDYSSDQSGAWDNVGSGGRRDFSDDDMEFDRTLEGEKSFYEILMEQFFIDVTDQKQRILGVFMMDMLDDAGYFTGDIEHIAHNFGCEVEEVEEVLAMMQTLEPTGIFARNLSECLQLQLKERNRLDPCMFMLLQNLELLAAGKTKMLCDICDCDEEDLMDMIREIKSLNPKPMAGLAHKEHIPSAPDVIIARNNDGNFTVQVNNAALPKVLVDKKYYMEVSEKTKLKEERQFIKANFHSANFLVKALEQRAETMLRTATAIVKFQEEFFKYGIKYLKPLTLARVAEELGMHESTISRVTTNKYLQTPRGNFEMKFFFTSGVSNSGGEIASTSVKETIKELIAGEDRKKPMSDDAIAEELKKRGINISRRTVMKYREAMKIASSYDRKANILNIA